MRVCGVELKGNEAIVCLLASSKGLYDLPDCRVRRLTLSKIDSREALQEFQFAFAKLMEDYQVQKVAIRERQTKGKFSGGAVGFKLEAAIQLIQSLDVELLSPSHIKGSVSYTPIPVRFADTGLKPFQEVAFVTAYACLNPKPYVEEAVSDRAPK